MKSDQSSWRTFLPVAVTTVAVTLSGVGAETPLNAIRTVQLDALTLSAFNTSDSVVFTDRGGKLAPQDALPMGIGASDWASIRAAYERHRHQVVRVAAHRHLWRARNPGQQWQTRFDERGFLVEPDGGGWTWGLELKRYGVVGAEREVGPEAQVRAGAQRVTYTWDSLVDEWFVNDARGLEHGFTLRERPPGGRGPVTLWLGVRGGLRPRVQPAGHRVVFLNARGESVVSYTGLLVVDANNRVMAARFEPEGDGLRLVVEDRGAKYPLTIDPVAQQAYLKASNTGSGDQFGISVAVSGDTVVVGAQGEDSNATGVDSDQTDNSASNAGAAYVFVRSGGVWTQQAYLKASNTGNPGDFGDLFGYSVAVSGDTVVVGAPFEDSNATGIDGDQASNNASNSGAAYVFVRDAGVWSQQAYLKASNAGSADQFGESVAVSGDTIAVSADLEASSATGVNGDQANNDAYGAGAVYVFARSGGLWSQQAYLKASNTSTWDQFGIGLAVSGDTVVAGAWGEDSSATGLNGDQSSDTASNAGAAYVFVRAGGVWTQQTYIKASNSGAGDGFGYSVAASGHTAVIGAYFESSSATGVDGDQANNNAFRSGAAYVFARTGVVWAQQAYLKASNTASEASFGFSVAVLGDSVVVGAPFEDSNATGVDGDQANSLATDAGAAYAFARSGGVWSQQAYLKASNTGTVGGLADLFGWSVTVSENTVVVGALGERSNATGVDGDQTNNSATSAGAVYVFTVVTDDLTPPTIDCEAPDGVWHLGNVSLACTAEDSQSGLADSADASFSLTTSVALDQEDANAFTDSRQVCDQASNCTTADSISGNMVDRRAPWIILDAPLDGATLVVGQNVLADYECQDVGSGMASCAGPVTSGSNVSTSNPGSFTFVVDATDAVGNSASETVSYTVAFNTCLLYDPTKAHRTGSTIPIKIQLCDANGLNVSSAGLAVTAQAVTLASTNASGSLEDSGQANPDLNFRYDAALGGSGGYIFNLSTKGLGTGTYNLSFVVTGDPLGHAVQFQVK